MASSTEQKLREKIAYSVWEAMQFARNCSAYCWETQPNANKIWSEQILALTDAYYKEKYKDWVKLADNQSLPSVYEIQRAFTELNWSTCENLRNWLFTMLAGWRKVEVKDGT